MTVVEGTEVTKPDGSKIMRVRIKKPKGWVTSSNFPVPATGTVWYGHELLVVLGTWCYPGVVVIIHDMWLPFVKSSSNSCVWVWL